LLFSKAFSRASFCKLTERTLSLKVEPVTETGPASTSSAPPSALAPPYWNSAPAILTSPWP